MYQFKNVAGFGIDPAKRPIRKSFQPCPVALLDKNSKQKLALLLNSAGGATYSNCYRFH